jgi:hypothetical protein
MSKGNQTKKTGHGEGELNFNEAQDKNEATTDSKETIYFNKETCCMRDAVGEALNAFDGDAGQEA